MSNRSLLKNNDNDFVYHGFRDTRITPIADSYLNAATTATWELRTAADGGGTQVTSGTLTYVTGSNGDYIFGIDDAVALTVGITYWITVILVQSGVKAEINESYVAARRTGRTPTS